MTFTLALMVDLKNYNNVILFNIFLYTGYVSVYIDKIAKHIYNSVYGVDYIVAIVSACYKSVYNYVKSIVVENNNDSWINISYISTKSLSQNIFLYKEVYKHVNLDIYNSLKNYKDLLIKPLKDINNELVGDGNMDYEDLDLDMDLNLNPNIRITETDDSPETILLNMISVGKLMFKHHKLIILKLKTEYVCRLYFERMSDSHVDYGNLLSKFKIRTLMYQHPDLKQDLILKIHDGYCLNGNEILSSVFIARLLQQQYGIKNVPFDSRYTLFGFDNSINMFRLNSDEFLKINKSSFKVLRMSVV